MHFKLSGYTKAVCNYIKIFKFDFNGCQQIKKIFISFIQSVDAILLKISNNSPSTNKSQVVNPD